jgi:hypothetical protein
VAKTAALTIRKLADKSAGERVARFDPETGARYLADPETWDRHDESTWVETPWPLAGIQIEGKPPKEMELSSSWVSLGVAEGWIELEGAEAVHRPGGRPDNPWALTHTFLHAEAIVLKTVDGDVRYRVLDNPDKWPEEKNDRDEGFGGEVRWFYRARLED